MKEQPVRRQPVRRPHTRRFTTDPVRWESFREWHDLPEEPAWTDLAEDAWVEHHEHHVRDFWATLGVIALVVVILLSGLH